MAAQIAPSLAKLRKCGRCKTADADLITGALKAPRCGVCYRLDRAEAAPLYISLALSLLISVAERHTETPLVH